MFWTQVPRALEAQKPRMSIKCFLGTQFSGSEQLDLVMNCCLVELDFGIEKPGKCVR
jgi:hypothetical protein